MVRIAIAFIALYVMMFSGCGPSVDSSADSQAGNNADVQQNEGSVQPGIGGVVPPPVTVPTPVPAVVAAPILPPPPPAFVVPVGGVWGGPRHRGGHADDDDDGQRRSCTRADAPACHGQCPQGQNCVDNDGKCECIKAERAYVSLEKTANVSIVPAVGQVITYTFTLTNGPVALTDVSIEDTSFSGAGELSPLTCIPAQSAELLAYEQLVCTATYTVQALDVGRDLTNTAYASGQDSRGRLVSDRDMLVIPGAQGPVASITLIKIASPETYAEVGQTIDYGLVATNGPVALNDVVMTDPGINILSCESPVGTPVALPFDLPANQVLLCLASYVIIQADIDAGQYENTAEVVGLNGAVEVSDEASVLITYAPVAVIALGKSAQPDNFTAAGDIITYTITATNGPVALDNVVISDTDALASVACESPVGTPVVLPFDLPANQELICSGTYAITAGDVALGFHNILAGFHNNTATVIGFNGIAEVSDSDILSISSTTSVPAIVAISKAADPPTFSDEGNIIEYTMSATNGSVALTNVNATDTDALAGFVCESPAGTPITLPLAYWPAGQSITCFGSYTTTAADVLANKHENTFAVSGTSGIGQVISQVSLIIDLEQD